MKTGAKESHGEETFLRISGWVSKLETTLAIIASSVTEARAVSIAFLAPSPSTSPALS